MNTKFLEQCSTRDLLKEVNKRLALECKKKKPKGEPSAIFMTLDSCEDIIKAASLVRQNGHKPYALLVTQQSLVNIHSFSIYAPFGSDYTNRCNEMPGCYGTVFGIPVHPGRWL